MRPQRHFLLALLSIFISFVGCSPVLRHLQQSSPCNYVTTEVCGNLSIPYPFGMSDICGLPEYRISCKRNASYGDGYLPFLQIGTANTSELQVLEFLTNTLIVNSTHLKAMPASKDCPSIDVSGHAVLELLKGGPFILSQNNWFVVVGCSSQGDCTADTVKNESSTISCTTSCYNQFVMDFCNYYACCINPIPPGSWRLDFQGRGISYAAFPGLCGFSTVLSPLTYTIPENKKGLFAEGHYGLSLSWALQLLDDGQNCSTAKQRTDYACSDMAECIYDESIHGYTCNCTQGYRGDGYKAGIGCQGKFLSTLFTLRFALTDGMSRTYLVVLSAWCLTKKTFLDSDIDECKEDLDECEKPPLGMCTNTVGSYICNCTEGEGGSGLPGSCPMVNHATNVLLPALLGCLAGAVVLALVLAFIWTSRRAYMERRERQENFQRSGGDQLGSFLFSERQLLKATNGFCSDHVIGEGGFGKVYWGKLSTEQGTIKVAIKRAKPKVVEEQVAQMQSFVKEIILLSKTVHKNVVKLLGCCVETSVPLLVFEFVERGTLQDYLKPQGRDSSLILQGGKAGSGCNSLWAWRMHIAVETAEALSYLHNKSEPIFHLDMKSANILIDKQYSPKVADFGLSCFLTSDATHLTNALVAGSFGYVDPEYYHSLRITDKCDVYSFGVILLELISSWPASCSAAVLAHHFRAAVNMREEIDKHAKQLPSFIDSRLEFDADVLASINGVAEVAHCCVSLRGSDRPSMQEVVHQLKQVQLKNSGKLKFRGSRGGHVPSDHFLLSTTRRISSNDNEVVPLVYAGSFSDQSASSSSLFSSAKKESDVIASTGSRSVIIELQQCAP
ncbi:hypothetical protein L7F22_025276 [Adiantum nelumboides]|nr:hypothetical protein [Adiantum nelumboides]